MSGPSIVEDFYGEPLSRDLAARIAGTPLDQIEELLDRLKYTAPNGGWTQSAAELIRVDGAPDPWFLEHNGHELIREATGLPNLILYSEALVLPDPLMRLRVDYWTGSHAARQRRADAGGSNQNVNVNWSHEVVAARDLLALTCADLVQLMPLVRGGSLQFVPRPDLGTREYSSYSVMINNPVVREAIGLDSWIDDETPTAWAALLYWQSMLGDDDPWRTASYTIIGKVDLNEFGRIMAIDDLSRMSGMVPVFTSKYGTAFARYGDKVMTGAEATSALSVPRLDLDLSLAMRVRADEEVFAVFRSALSQILAIEPHGSGAQYRRELDKASEDLLKDCLAQLERIRSRSAVLAMALPAASGSLLGLAVGALTGGIGKAAGHSAGNYAGRRAASGSAVRRDSADAAYGLTRNLLELGRL